VKLLTQPRLLNLIDALSRKGGGRSNQRPTRGDTEALRFPALLTQED
jgi:hypothetical protein